MKIRLLAYFLFISLFYIACQKWDLPEKCTEVTPSKINVTGSTTAVFSLAGNTGITDIQWSLVNSSNTVVNTAQSKDYQILSTNFPNGTYKIRASGKTSICHIPFSIDYNDFIINTPIVEMVTIPSGSFQMGGTEGEANERPAHTVTLNEFKMSKYEITQKQYKTVIGTNPSGFADCDACPVETVSWFDAINFCNILSEREGKQKVYSISNGSNITLNPNANGYRLPTEAEWEYAAGGGSSNRTRFGNGTNIANSNEINFNAGIADIYSAIGLNRGKTTSAGTFNANKLGLYDMSGNVLEWCYSFYDNYPGSTAIPVGFVDLKQRVLRGGSWSDSSKSSRISHRNSGPPDARFNSIGFRIVVTP